MPAMTDERGSSNDAMTAKMTGGRKGMTPKNVIDPRRSRRRKEQRRGGERVERPLKRGGLGEIHARLPQSTMS